MPSLDDINQKRETKIFKKRDYRPWNMEGVETEHVMSSSQENNSLILSEDRILFVSPYEIKNWEFHDRPENELGDIESLANEFKEIGQQQPCIVRPLSPPAGQLKYELIAGERRWHAAKKAQINLKVIVKNLSDSESAIIQASENLSRKGLSEYARGMSYSKLIEKGIITPKELTEKLAISKQQVSRLLSFGKIPKQILDAIGDLSKISSRTAEQIKQLSSKGDIYIDGIINIADKLREGKVGQEKLKSLVEHFVNIDDTSHIISNKVYSKNGRHLFTWRLDNNKTPSIHFPKDIANLIKQRTIDNSQITKSLQEVLDEILRSI